MDTLRRVHFEKAATPSSNGGGTLTPASPPKIKVVKTFFYCENSCKIKFKQKLQKQLKQKNLYDDSRQRNFIIPA